jgi:hypothetical protein
LPAAFLALLAALLFAPAIGAATAPPVASPDELQLSAERIEQDLAANLLTASGGVELRLTGLAAQGERLIADLKERVARMPGPVTLITSSGRVTGEDLRYAWDRRQGRLAKAETVNRGLRLASREADVSPDQVVLHDGLFTKCLLPTPEYAFLARRVEVDPETQMVTARGVTLALFGHRLLPLPNLRFSLQDTPVGRTSRERLPIPSAGYDSDRGFFVHDEFPVHLSDQAIALAGGGYGTKEGGRLTLAGLYAPSPTTTYQVDVRYRERDPAGRPDVDGVFRFAAPSPAGQVTVVAEEKDDDHRQDLAFLPRVELTPPTFRLAGLSVTPTLEWANIREEVSARATSRSLARLAWSARPPLTGRFTLGLSGTASQAAYGSGELLTSSTASAVVAHPVAQTVSLEARYNYAEFAGATPFSFDQPERRREGELGLAWREAAQAASLSAVYNLATAGPPELTRPSALKGSASVSTGAWSLTSDARYELGPAPYYSTLTLRLVRHLHCFDVSLLLEPREQRFSLGVVLR